MALFEKVLHLAILVVYLAVWNHFVSMHGGNIESDNPKIKLYSRFGARFLTKWTYAVQTIYYLCIVLADWSCLIPFARSASDKLRGFANVIFTTIAIPVGLIVSVVFWTIYNIDRELIFPVWMDKIVPPWVNHAIHTGNSLLPLLDMMVVNHTFSSWAFSVTCLAGYLAAYMVCLLETYYTYGKWLYPILEKLTYPQLACFLLSTFLLALLFHAITRVVNELRWGEKTPYEKLKQSKTKRKIKKQA